MSYSRHSQKPQLPLQGLQLFSIDILPGLSLQVDIENRIENANENDVRLELTLDGDNCGSVVAKNIYEVLEILMVSEYRPLSLSEADIKKYAEHKRIRLRIGDNKVRIEGAALVKYALDEIISKIQEKIFKLKPEDENSYLAELRCFKQIIKNMEKKIVDNNEAINKLNEIREKNEALHKKEKELNKRVPKENIKKFIKSIFPEYKPGQDDDVIINQHLNGCDLYLMSSNVDSFILSDKNHLYLYKDDKNGFFYYLKDTQEKQYLKFLDEEQKRLLVKEKYNQFVENPVIICTKPEITNGVFKETSNLGHTHLNKNNISLLDDIPLWNDIKFRLPLLKEDLFKKHKGLEYIFNKHQDYETKIEQIRKKDGKTNEDILSLIDDEIKFRKDIEEECRKFCPDQKYIIPNCFNLENKRDYGVDLFYRSINNINENRKFVEEMNFVNNWKVREKEVVPILKKLTTLDDEIKKLKSELDLLNIVHRKIEKYRKLFFEKPSEKRNEEGTTSLTETQQKKPGIKEKDNIQKLEIAQKEKEIAQKEKEKDKIEEQLTQQKSNKIKYQLQDSPRKEKIRVTTLEQLMIAQQKRDVIQELEDEILRLKEELIIKAYLEFITIIKNSDINHSINEVLINNIFTNEPLKNLDNKSILEVLTDKRFNIGFFSTNLTSVDKLVKLFNLPDPKEIFSSPSAKKPKFSIRQQNIH